MPIFIRAVSRTLWCSTNIDDSMVSVTGTGGHLHHIQSHGGAAASLENLKEPLTVDRCSKDEQNAFIRKALSIILFQLVATAGVGYLFVRPELQNALGWIQSHQWLPMLLTGIAFANLVALCMRFETRIYEVALLFNFSILKTFLFGILIASTQTELALQALFVTSNAFVGTILWTIQPQTSFWNLGPLLMAGICGFAATHAISAYHPFASSQMAAYALAASGIFTMCVLAATWLSTRHLSQDRYVTASFWPYIEMMRFILMIFNGLLWPFKCAYRYTKSRFTPPIQI